MGPILFVVFIVVPLLELFVIIQVGQVIGAGPTILLLLLVSISGAFLVKREGLRAWRRFREALAQGRVPAQEVVDGALLLFGGALLLTPGFITDALGLLLLIPPTRAALRRILRKRFVVVGSSGMRQGGASARPGAQAGRRPQAGRTDTAGDGVIDVEVVDIRRDDDTRGQRDGG